MTPAQWSDTVGTMWAGDSSGAAKALRHAVGEVNVDERFLIWETHDWIPSTTPELPVDTAQEERLAEFRRSGERGWWSAVTQPQPKRRRRGY